MYSFNRYVTFGFDFYVKLRPVTSIIDKVGI